ncbi:MAG: hypothetical protein HUU35_17815, partial [Armatimonadetes bacterium]|nr:hypothetical protein [Armatimonadota bacterium]
MKSPSDDARLSAYLDEMLSGREMVRLRSKLRQAPEAEHELEALRRTVHCLRALPDPSPPPDFWPRANQRLRAFARAHALRLQLLALLRPLMTIVVAVTALGLLGLA